MANDTKTWLKHTAILAVVCSLTWYIPLWLLIGWKFAAGFVFGMSLCGVISYNDYRIAEKRKQDGNSTIWK
jgi:hypothetical protein